jgi:hypothetical protein
MDLYHEAMGSPGAVAAMKDDGIRAETLLVLTES